MYNDWQQPNEWNRQKHTDGGWEGKTCFRTLTHIVIATWRVVRFLSNKGKNSVRIGDIDM